MKKTVNLLNLKEHIIQTIESFGEANKAITPQEKRNASLKLINRVSSLNAAIALQPLPIADVILLTPIQVGMVFKISQIYGIHTNIKVIQEIIFTIVKGAIGRTFTRSLIKIIPFLGIPVSIFMSYIITKAMGLTAIKVFERMANHPSSSIKELFNEEYHTVKSQLDTIVEKTKDLKKLDEKSIIDKIIYFPSKN